MYYVIFERYSEFNQFEGQWVRDWEVYQKSSTAIKIAAEKLKNSDYREVSILKEI